MACAHTLHLHPNSLRYRLAKIEKALGRSLRSPQTIADLYLALRAGELHAHSDFCPARSSASALRSAPSSSSISPSSAALRLCVVKLMR